MIEQLRADLKQALLKQDKELVTVLRGILAVLQNETIAKKEALNEQEIVAIMQRETKRREDAARLYDENHHKERAEKERYEKNIIERYLPEQLDDDALLKVVQAAIAESDDEGNIGKIISVVRAEVGAAADGARIARFVKGEISK